MPAYFRSWVSTLIISPLVMNSGTMSLQAGLQLGFLPGGVDAAADRWRSVHHLQGHLRRQDDVDEIPFEEQGLVFLVLLDEPAAFARQLGWKVHLLEGLRVHERVGIALLVAELHQAVLKLADGHPLILGKGAIKDAAGLEVAHADVQLVPGLGGAGGVKVLEVMRHVVQ